MFKLEIELGDEKIRKQFYRFEYLARLFVPWKHGGLWCHNRTGARLPRLVLGFRLGWSDNDGICHAGIGAAARKNHPNWNLK
jgi:hypothetical protein